MGRSGHNRKSNLALAVARRRNCAALTWPHDTSGSIFGLFIVVVSNWILLPLITGQVFGQPNQVLFGGWNTTRMWVVACIVGGFGLGIIYGLIARDRTA